MWDVQDRDGPCEIGTGQGPNPWKEENKQEKKKKKKMMMMMMMSNLFLYVSHFVSRVSWMKMDFFFPFRKEPILTAAVLLHGNMYWLLKMCTDY